jgi:ribosomal subunit interface protein
MQIEIQSRDFSLTDALENHVHKRLEFTLARGGRKVRRVEVRLSDLNGPRGGVDKRCLIEVRLDGLPVVVVEDIQSDLYTAIDRAATRAGRTVMRRLAQEGARWRPAAARFAHHGLPEL